MHLYNFFQRFKFTKILFILFFSIFSFNAYSMSLTELIQGLLENDSSIKSSESAVKEAKNDIQTAWNAYLPELDLKLIRGMKISISTRQQMIITIIKKWM